MNTVLLHFPEFNIHVNIDVSRPFVVDVYGDEIHLTPSQITAAPYDVLYKNDDPEILQNVYNKIAHRIHRKQMRMES